MEHATWNTVLARLKIAANSDTDQDLAKKLGLSKQSIADAKSKKNVPASWIPKAAQLFNVSTDWLFFERGPMRPADSLDQPQANLIHPAAPPSQADCPRCAKLEAKLEKVEQQRDVLVEENRKLWEKNSELITMNGKLNTQVAKLEAEVQKPGIYKQDIAQTGVA